MHESRLRLRLLGIDTQQEHVINMRRDCHVCRAEASRRGPGMPIAAFSVRWAPVA